MNFTILVPNGTTNHGNPNLLCTPPKWYDFLIFYFANYLAHAATIVTLPGQGALETSAAVIAALFIPTSGVMRATKVIIRRAGLVKNDPLRRAARAGALCMVVKALKTKESST